MSEPLWLFGYGSLLFKPPLHHLDIDMVRFDGTVTGYVRRFWQSSSDNRGTPAFLGRVVTIVSADDVSSHEEFHASVQAHELRDLPTAQADALLRAGGDALTAALKVGGCVYYVPAADAAAARAYLDVREQEGYRTEEVEFSVCEEQHGHKLLAGREGKIVCTVYVGPVDGNASFVGAERETDTGKIIARAVGPSGPNVEYLHRLYEHQQHDTYLKALVDVVDRVQSAETLSHL